MIFVKNQGEKERKKLELWIQSGLTRDASSLVFRWSLCSESSPGRISPGCGTASPWWKSWRVPTRPGHCTPSATCRSWLATSSPAGGATSRRSRKCWLTCPSPGSGRGSPCSTSSSSGWDSWTWSALQDFSSGRPWAAPSFSEKFFSCPTESGTGFSRRFS